MSNTSSQNFNEFSNTTFRTQNFTKNKIYYPIPIRAEYPSSKHMSEKISLSSQNFAMNVNKANNKQDLKMANCNLNSLSSLQYTLDKTSLQLPDSEICAYNIQQFEPNKINLDSESEELSSCAIPISQKEIDQSSLLCWDSKEKKPIRKQTSFTKSDVKSIEESFYDNPNTNSATAIGFTTKSKPHGCRNENGVVSTTRHDDCYSEHSNIEGIYFNQSKNENQTSSIEAIQGTHIAKMIGLLTEQERKIKVQNYLVKKQKRRSINDVRYECRQNLAHKRFRFQGRFVRQEDLPIIGKHLIIDFDGKKLLKPIFQIEKANKRQLKQDRIKLVNLSLH